MRQTQTITALAFGVALWACDTRAQLPMDPIPAVVVEDLDLEVLAEDCKRERARSCYAFTLIVQMVPIRGAGGSPVAPTAIR